MTKKEKERIIDLARSIYGSDDVEVDDNAKIIVANPNYGSNDYWVQAWVWVQDRQEE